VTGGAQNRRYMPIVVTNAFGTEVPFVSASSLIVLTKERENALPPSAKKGCGDVRALMTRDPVIVRGPFPTAHQFVDARSANFEKAHKAYAKGSTLRGGDDSGLNVFSAAIGFSGLPTALARHQILITSVAAWLISQVDTLDVYCPSIGIIPVLHSSLLAVKQVCPTQCIWRFITSYTDSTKVDPVYSDYVETSFRHGAHRLWVSDKVMPSAKKCSDLLLKSGENMDQIVKEGVSFTFFGPLFGACPWMQGRYVHRFALPSNFWGFCGTLPNLSLLGMTGETVDGLMPIVKPLDKVSTDAELYEIVIKANLNRNAVFLKLGRQYSPISNIIIPPFKGVKFVTRGTDLSYAEQGDADDFYDTDEDESGGDEAQWVAEEGEDEYDRGEGEFDDRSDEEDPVESGSTTASTTSILRPSSSVRSTKAVMFDQKPPSDIGGVVPLVPPPSISLGPILTTASTVVVSTVSPSSAIVGLGVSPLPSPPPPPPPRLGTGLLAPPASPDPEEKEVPEKRAVKRRKAKQPGQELSIVDGELGVFEAGDFMN